MLKVGRVIPGFARKRWIGNAQHMNKYFKGMHERDNQSIRNSINPELDAISGRPDIRRHIQPEGSRRQDDPQLLYHKRLDADYSPQRISEVKDRMMENPLTNQFNMSAWEFQKRPWKRYGEKQVPYHQTYIISIHFTWNNIRFYMMDPNWERFYQDKAPNDFNDEKWKENFFGSNEFFTKLGPYGNCHIFSSMRGQGYMGSSARVDANVEYVAGKFGTEIINRGYDPYVRVVIDFWGKQKSLRATAVKGLLSSGIRVVSFTEGTVDAEHVIPKLKQRITTVSSVNVGMWDRFYRARDRERNSSADEPEQ